MRNKTAILLLILGGLLLYITSLFNGFVADDFLQIVQNTKVHNIQNIPDFFTLSTYDSRGADKIAGLYFRPIMMVVYTIIYASFGGQPFYFHLFQMLLHITNALLVFILLRHFFKSGISFFLSAIFLAHPINTEAVVYAANLQDTLFFCFGILAVILMIKQKTTFLFGKIIFFLLLLLALFSKESGILFLFVILLYHFVIQKKEKLLFLSSCIGSLLVHLFLRYGVAHMHLAQHSIAPISSASLYTRLINVPAMFFYYLERVFFPLNLGVDQYWLIKKISFADFYIPLLGVLVFFFLVLLLGRYIYEGSEKRIMQYIFFFGWFVGGMFFHMQIIPLDATVADRWFYFPLVGLLGLFGMFLDKFFQENKNFAKWGVVAGVTLIVILSIRTVIRTQDWKDGLTLFSHDVRTTRKNFLLENALASELIIAGKVPEAKPYILSSVKEHAYYANLNNLAIVYASEGNIAEAKQSLLLAMKSSQNYSVYENYANFLLTYDDLQQAKTFSAFAVKTFPKNAKLWSILAKSSYLLNDKKTALQASKNASVLSSTKEYQTLYELIRDNKPIVVLRKDI